MKKILVILAAGIGSRFGGGIKQLEPIDNYGHIIIDYSIHDAISAGFNKIVFIIRHDIEDEFRSVIGNRIEKICYDNDVELAYAYQDIKDYSSIDIGGRNKPWGTGHAVLCASEFIDSPFSVINADDYYGKEGFIKAAEFLEKKQYGLIGYILKNTLSDNGGVTRGICKFDNEVLVGIEETKNIVKTETGAVSNGKIIDINSVVSMNFWCYPVEFIEILKKGFPKFQANLREPDKEEYLLPIIADEMLNKGYTYTVIPTADQWFGVTYKEDKEVVIKNFNKMIENGVYKAQLY